MASLSQLGQIPIGTLCRIQEGLFVADAAYQEAIDDGHGFRWDDWEDNIVLAREGFEQLYRELKKKR